MNPFQKIRAGALQFVLFIGVLIAMLLLAFVTLSHTHTFFGKKTTQLIKTIKRTDIGLAYAMQTHMNLNDTLRLDVGLEDAIELTGIKTYWGVFERYTITATSTKYSFSKSALVGTAITKGIPALYLKNNNRPLVVVGNTKIKGDAYVPQRGIKAGNISGNSYYGTQLLYGQQKQSRATLPKIDVGLKNHLMSVSKNNGNFIGRKPILLSQGLVVENSFLAPVKYILGGVIELADIALTGNIIVQANQKIIVDASSRLQDVVLIAPEIEIRAGVKATFQAIATKHISIGRQSELFYPSALVVYEEATRKLSSIILQKPSIQIAENAQISGIVLYLGKQKKTRFYPQITIEEGSSIVGEVYCEENLELSGKVWGNVTTSAFISLKKGSIYQNHLYNATINSELLPIPYAGLLYDRNINTKKVTKWLY